MTAAMAELCGSGPVGTSHRASPRLTSKQHRASSSHALSETSQCSAACSSASLRHYEPLPEYKMEPSSEEVCFLPLPPGAPLQASSTNEEDDSFISVTLSRTTSSDKDGDKNVLHPYNALQDAHERVTPRTHRPIGKSEVLEGMTEDLLQRGVWLAGYADLDQAQQRQQQQSELRAGLSKLQQSLAMREREARTTRGLATVPATFSPHAAPASPSAWRLQEHHTSRDTAPRSFDSVPPIAPLPPAPRPKVPKLRLSTGSAQGSEVRVRQGSAPSGPATQPHWDPKPRVLGTGSAGPDGGLRLRQSRSAYTLGLAGASKRRAPPHWSHGKHLGARRRPADVSFPPVSEHGFDSRSAHKASPVQQKVRGPRGKVVRPTASISFEKSGSPVAGCRSPSTAKLLHNTGAAILTSRPAAAPLLQSTSTSPSLAPASSPTCSKSVLQTGAFAGCDSTVSHTAQSPLSMDSYPPSESPVVMSLGAADPDTEKQLEQVSTGGSSVPGDDSAERSEAPAAKPTRRALVTARVRSLTRSLSAKRLSDVVDKMFSCARAS